VDVRRCGASRRGIALSSATGVDFVLILHTHLPYVLQHGRWPHGSDWLMEAATESYLPLIDSLERLRREGVDAPVTLGVTPVVASQLCDPSFAGELHAFIAQRLEACDAAERELAAVGDDGAITVVRHWRSWYEQRARQFDRLEGGIVGALRSLEDDGRCELISSAATHGFLPLLARDESIRLQLFAGRDEHQRLFGRAPAGCWLPECAYRPAGTWAPLSGVAPRDRTGIETSLEEAHYRFVVVDAHLARAGEPLELYAAPRSAKPVRTVESSPYHDYVIGAGSGAVHAFVRDPVATRQVWSRDGGYPGGAAYLEFHKIRFPGGLQLWEITGPGVDLGDKQLYDPARGSGLAREHARHFAEVLRHIAQREQAASGSVIVAPFDTELFGHWWYEGPAFLEGTYRALHGGKGVRPLTASAHLRGIRRVSHLDLPAGSWGANGDFSFWLNPQTEWIWRRTWDLEERFWNAAPAALASADTRPILAQAARELLLAQASDWAFMISAGEVPDYGERRFRLHADDLEALLEHLERGDPASGVMPLVEKLRERDGLFPGILDAVTRSLAGHAVLV
jgi:1,4-alpha-glucan branching enzyme